MKRFLLVMLATSIASGETSQNAVLEPAADTATATSLWRAYRAAPDTQPNIPNCSYAGYHAGEEPLPAPPVVANVRDCGATGNGRANDTSAFEAALEEARRAGGGAVLVPAGTYRLTNVLRLTQSGIVLRGEGTNRSILQFERPLAAILGLDKHAAKSQWSWLGGLIWIGPAETFGADGRVDEQPWDEEWPELPSGAAVTKPAKRGERGIEVAADAAVRLQPGQLVLLSWRDPTDHSLLQHIAGHPRMAGADWGSLAGCTWTWPVEVASVQGSRVTLRQPLRCDIRPEWHVQCAAAAPASFVREIGVERLTLRFPAHPAARHLHDAGYNGIYFNRAVHCWAREIAIENTDNGVIFAAAKNCTVSELAITGGANHHATATRVGSADNLVERFRIDSRPHHGINTEGLSSGNVWRDGLMAHGTFDSHRAMSFDSLRTNITLANDDGTPGGANDAGPFVGARMVHWNIRVTGHRAEWVFQPSCLTMGALVGIQGPSPDMRSGWAMPHGDKGTIIADPGHVPEPPDLYQAQLALRLGTGTIKR